MNDPINHPAHYTQGGIECIQAIKAALTEEEFVGFLKGQILKYTWRSGHKDGADILTDTKKGIWYADYLCQFVELVRQPMAITPIAECEQLPKPYAKTVEYLISLVSPHGWYIRNWFEQIRGESISRWTLVSGPFNSYVEAKAEVNLT